MSAAVKPIQEAAIRQYAKQLRLPTLGGQFARLAEQAVKEKQSHLSYLEALLEGEVEERERKAMARRIQEAVAVVGDRERVIASADCGFGTFTGREWVIEPAVWLKLKSLREGADIASSQLWGRKAAS